MKVRCIDNAHGLLPLTINKIYEVLNAAKDQWDMESTFTILDDKNIRVYYLKERFEIVEDENESMNNEYDIYEIISDFKEGVIFNCKEPSCYKADKFKIKNRKLMILDHLGRWNEFKSIPGCTLSMRFTMHPIQKPVSFDQVLCSDKKCRVEHELFDFNRVFGDGYFGLDSILYEVANYLDEIEIKRVIREGKWYLEE